MLPGCAITNNVSGLIREENNGLSLLIGMEHLEKWSYQLIIGQQETNVYLNTLYIELIDKVFQQNVTPAHSGFIF